MGDITLHPDSEQSSSLINGNKGLIIAAIVVIIAVGIGIFSFINSSSSAKFQGMIKKVQTETQNIKQPAF